MEEAGESDTITITRKKDQVKIQPDSESQVTVHGFVRAGSFESGLRIWKTTYLIPHGHSEKSRLLHVENISMYPEWTPVPANSTFRFTLYFSALPKGCKSFDLIEIIPQPGGFEIKGIRRNQSDVYSVDFSD